MTDDPFESFAERYDELPQDDAERKTFFSYLIEKYRLKSVLDCACGTGNDLVLLQSLGLEVAGSDISQSMLNVTQKKLIEQSIDIPLKRIDFRYLSQHLDSKYNAVFCMTTSLPQLLDKAEILKALKSMKSVLKPDGILVLSQGLTDRQYSFRNRFFPIINTPEFSRIMAIDYYDYEWEVNVLDMIHTTEKNDFTVNSFRYCLMLKDDYESSLEEAGFADIEFCGNFELDPYEKETSNNLIVIAKI